MRRSFRKLLGVVVFWMLPGISAEVMATETLTIATFGGVYRESQEKAFFQPFTAETGVEIKIVEHPGGIEAMQQQIRSGQIEWDVVDLELADNLQACNLGFLATLDHSKLAPAPDGTPATKDFFPDTLHECGVANVIYATVLGVNFSYYTGQIPDDISHLFDIDKFPGKRALRRTPIALLEWALLSYGVPKAEVYSLLSTERGINLAFKRLDQIKDDIVWWENGSEPVELLVNKEVAIASAFNGRLFSANAEDGHTLRTIWDGHHYEYSTWGILKDAPNYDRAIEFLIFATNAERMAAQTKYISYGPARESAHELVTHHEASGLEIHPHLPTSSDNLSKGIAKDYEWYSHTYDMLRERFHSWVEE